MFTLHQINAFENQGHLVMDMCCGDDGAVIGDFTLENLSKASGEELDKVIDRTQLGFTTCQNVVEFNILCVKCVSQ